MLKLFKPFVSWRAIWAAIRVLRSGQLAEGPEVKKFEEEFAKYHGLDRCLAVNSGTSALELAYHLAGIGKGDKVLVPVLGCAATVAPLIRRGAKVEFVDIGEDLNIHVPDLANKVKGAKAIVFVAFGGNESGLYSCSLVARTYKIPLIYDAAQAIDGDMAEADYTCVSLQATKTVTSVDGGFLVCKSYEDHDRAKKLRWFGLARGVSLAGQTIEEAGYKFHMNDLAAAIGRANLRCLPKLKAHRDKLAAIYREAGLFPHKWLAGYIGERQRGCDFEQGQHHYRLDKVFGIKSDCPNMDRLEGKYWFVPYGHHVSVRQAKKIAKALR
jgi:perosamine synthetase